MCIYILHKHGKIQVFLSYLLGLLKRRTHNLILVLQQYKIQVEFKTIGQYLQYRKM